MLTLYIGENSANEKNFAFHEKEKKMQKYMPSLSELAHQLREKSLTVQELSEKCMENYAKTEHKFNAYKAWDGEWIRKQAKAVDELLGQGADAGPLMGIPVSIKDLYSVPHFPSYAGSALPLPADWAKAGPLVQELETQSAIIMGKTHTVEYAFGGLGCNAHWGSPKNPWSKDVARVSGGSSSGAGVSLVQGSALLAFGTDTGGSIRIPSSMTGQVGLKTTVGRWSTEGIFPLSSSLDTAGIMCRTVEDVVYAFQALDKNITQKICKKELSTIRIGVPKNFFYDDADTSIIDRVTEVISFLANQGAVVKYMALKNCDEAFAIFKKGGLAASEFYTFMMENYPERVERMDINVYTRFEAGKHISQDEYLNRKKLLQKYGERNLPMFNDYDVLVTPTVAINTPCDEDLIDANDYAKLNIMALRNTAIVNLFGWCALSLPAGLDHNGMPVGIQLMAPPFHEEKLLAVALAVEEALMTAFVPRQTMQDIGARLFDHL